MAAKTGGSGSPVDAVHAVYTALEPLDQDTRQRVVSSAFSLLGMATQPQEAPAATKRSGQQQQFEVTPTRGKSPVELVQEKNPATNAQRIAVFAYHREKYEGQSRFSRADLKAYFSKAKEPPPANYDRDFAAAIKQGWIHEDGSESYLTSKGLEAVEAGFGGKARPRGRAVAVKATKNRTGRKRSAKR